MWRPQENGILNSRSCLFRESLLGRWLNRFELARTFQRDAMFWDSDWIMVPSDALDTAMHVDNVRYVLFARTLYYETMFASSLHVCRTASSCGHAGGLVMSSRTMIQGRRVAKFHPWDARVAVSCILMQVETSTTCCHASTTVTATSKTSTRIQPLSNSLSDVIGKRLPSTACLQLRTRRLRCQPPPLHHQRQQRSVLLLLTWSSVPSQRHLHRHTCSSLALP